MVALVESSRGQWLHRGLNAALVTSAIVFIGGFAFTFQDFGYDQAAGLSLALLVWPLVGALHLRRRWRSVRGKDLAFLVLLQCVAVGGGGLIVHAWYDWGLHDDHARDVRWAEFERRCNAEPAFRNVRVHGIRGKSLYWANGAVDTEADLARLRRLASDCGIDPEVENSFYGGIRVRGGEE